MEIVIETKSSEKRELLEAVTAFYVKTLKLGNSKFSLTVSTVPNLTKELGMRGATAMVSDKHIAVALDSRLSIEMIFQVLAHEMVHVKQRCRGQLKHRVNKKGNVVWTWLGRDYKTTYLESPWEIEAFSRERVLANKVVSLFCKF